MLIHRFLNTSLPWHPGQQFVTNDVLIKLRAALVRRPQLKSTLNQSFPNSIP